MSMLDWARREVEIACKRERGESGSEEGAWDYGCACYESALKAYECLCGDGHSGMSWGFTAGILKRLMDNKPLTPIEDTEDVWGEVYCSGNEYKSYQCKRKSSLFKDVYEDGTVKYSDVDRVRCTEEGSDVYWSNGFVRRIIDDMFPITMPYAADKTYTVYRQEYLTDRKNGDYDTMSLLYAVDSDGVKTDIYRYFKDDPEGRSLIEIDRDEYYERVEMHDWRVKKEEEAAEVKDEY